jgi:hypothetical protein
MSRKTILIVVGILALLAVVPDIAARIAGHTPDNRHRLYALRSSVRPAMQRADVERLLQEQSDQNKISYKWLSRDQVAVWAPISFMKAYWLYIDLRDDRVIHASIRGNGGDKDRPADAPPDF